MPRVNLLSAETTARKKFSNNLRGNAHIVYRGMPGFGAAVGMSESTIRKRVADPMTFSVSELHDVRKALGVGKQEILDFLCEVI